ncbi:MAG: hypothetical protein ACRETG_00310 [Steroidobacteraceae bacterium]
MNAIPVTPLMLEIARRIVWFEPPETALASPTRFMAYAMTYAHHEDMRVIRRYVSDDDLREALDRAPPGIIDPRSWAYWNSKVGRYPPPPLPSRELGTASALKPLPEDPRRQGRAAWQNIKQQSTNMDPEEVRRRARQEWLAKYGPKDGD